MTEPRRPTRRSRGQAAASPTADAGELNPYREEPQGGSAGGAATGTDTAPPAAGETAAPATRRRRAPRTPKADGADPVGAVIVEGGAASFGGDAPSEAPAGRAPERPAERTPERMQERTPEQTWERAAERSADGAGDGGRETARDGARPDGRGGRESSRDGSADAVREMGRDGVRESAASEGGTESGREGGREGAREFRGRGRRRRRGGRDGEAPGGEAPFQRGGPQGGQQGGQQGGHHGQQGGPRHQHAPPGGQGAAGGNGYAPPGQPRERDELRGRGRRQRQRGRQRGDFADQRPAPAAVVADTEVAGWLDLGREGGFVRQATNSYLPAPQDAFIPSHLVRQYNLRKGDAVLAMAGRDHRGRTVVTEIRTLNEAEPQPEVKRPDFQALLATYPERKLRLETGKPAKTGPELTRRVVDLIAPIGFGQRALIVAPARSGKTMLLQAIVEGVAQNHPNAVLLVLLVDERPEEVSEMVQVGYGEVVASSFDMPAERHREVVEMVMERSRRLVEQNKDVVIVLDSITRMARAFNAMRGVGRTLSGGLDANAMQTPKAFFGSARAVAQSHGGGSLTIIGTALVETGSRMDDVIFEEFKGTGNCEIKLDRSLAEQRLFPAIDIPASGTRREDKLFRPEQLDAVFILRRGLQQMPSSAAITWLTKRIGNTKDNDTLLATLKDG